MDKKPMRPKEPDKTFCCTCGAPMAESMAKSSESQEYLEHFCSQDCKRQWAENNPKPQGI